MKKMIFSLIMLFLGISGLSAEEIVGSYTLPITRHGVTHSMVAYNFWSGEYPKPVIYLKHTHNNWSKIRGYTSLRNLTNRKVCTIKSGIYHPWSKDETSLIDYYSIIPKIDYVAMQNTTLGNQKIKKGDRLENEFYIAEGRCSYLLNKRRQIATTCIEEAIEDTFIFKRIKSSPHPREQWLYLNCREGYKIFVRDIDLLSQPNVRSGAISGYGRVTTANRR